MNNIKYRVWDKRINKMYFNAEHDPNWTDYLDYPKHYEVMQLIGCINNKIDIYEGDIVICAGHYFELIPKDFQIYARQLFTNRIVHFHALSNITKVAGNIYQNKFTPKDVFKPIKSKYQLAYIIDEEPAFKEQYILGRIKNNEFIQFEGDQNERKYIPDRFQIVMEGIYRNNAYMISGEEVLECHGYVKYE